MPTVQMWKLRLRRLSDLLKTTRLGRDEEAGPQVCGDHPPTLCAAPYGPSTLLPGALGSG